MPHLALHRELVVRILRLMVCLCILASLQPALLLAGALKVSWNANTEPDLAGYKIYHGKSSRNYTVSINVGKVTEYTVDQLSEGVAYFFVVTAYDLAGNESGYSQEVSAQVLVDDRTPPAVVKFHVVNQQRLKVVFDEMVTAATAQNKANYTISNSVEVRRAKLWADARTVMLHTSPHAFDVSYTLTISGIADRAPTPNVISEPISLHYSFQAVDTTPPVVANVRAANQTAVEVFFSEPVTKASAEDKINYTIDKGIVISSAALQADTRTVQLTTSPHTDGETYTLTVRQIADRAIPANVMPEAATFKYIFQAEDRQAPEVNSVTLADLTHLRIVFNERVTRSSAENVKNYRISDGIRVLEGRLADNGLEVTLLTAPHQYNKDYTIVILNIQDTSPAGNIMVTSPALTYFVVNNPGGNYAGLSVNELSPAQYVLDSLQVGDLYYIDRPYLIKQIPSSKQGLLWVKTANADRSKTSERFLEFTLTGEANVWVAYDDRAGQPPNWLKNFFTRTNESIAVSESAGRLGLWKSHRLPGRVTLGGNLASGVQAATSLSMYVVLIEDLQGPKPGDAQTPQGFTLYQNYPNPFSVAGNISGRNQGRTEIKYHLEEAHYVELTVRNMLGQVVRRLQSGIRPPGTHSAFWDGRDKNGEPAPSGNYICTLEVRDEMKNGRLTMAASLSRQTRVITLLK